MNRARTDLERQHTLHCMRVYDARGGLANDNDARHAAARKLADDLGVDPLHAYELLADALARRAAQTSHILNQE